MGSRTSENRRPERLSGPLVTIVTPSYNQGCFIEETIRSVITQDYPSIEYLVMDGGSTDGTISVLERYAGHLSYISERDKGQSHAINEGFRRGRGEILTYLNSDDTYAVGAVSAAVAALQDDPAAPFVYGEAFHVAEGGEIIGRYPTEPFSQARLRQTCFICQPAAFMRRAAVEAVGYLDESLRYCMDYDLWIRLSRLGQPLHLSRYLANSRLHRSSKTLAQRRSAHWEIVRMWRRHDGVVPSPWVFGLAHVIIETRFQPDRTRRLHNGLFLLGIATLSAYLCLRLNHRIIGSERRQVLEWMSRLLRGVGRLGRKGPAE